MLSEISLTAIKESLKEIIASLKALLTSFVIWYETSLNNKSKQDIKAAQAIIDNNAIKTATEREINALSDKDLATRAVQD